MTFSSVLAKLTTVVGIYQKIKDKFLLWWRLSTNSHLIRTFFYNKPMPIGREALLIEIHIILRNIYCLEVLTICKRIRFNI